MTLLEDTDYRYIRTGWFDQDRACDAFVKQAVKAVPGDIMPARWSPKDFVETYGVGVKWSQTASYHLLLISGTPVLRIWTNAKYKTLVEIADPLVPVLRGDGFLVVEIPEGTKKKRGEFRWRLSVTLKEEITLILEEIKAAYDVGKT